MNRVTKQQVSFEKGMMETFKQEGLGAPDNLTSVLYLENYNPNIEQMSLVKRPGLVSGSSGTDLNNFDGLNYYRGSANDGTSTGGVLDRGAINTALLPYTAANIRSTTQWDAFVSNFIQHYTIIETSNFDSNKTHLLFSKANLEYAYIKAALMPDLSGFTDLLPSVLITSYSKYLASPTTTFLTTGWYNSWKRYFDLSLRDPNTFEDQINAQQAFPGWWALGNFRDSVRYGESQLFSTSFNPSDIAAIGLTTAQQKLLLPYLYPVYKWALWDIRKKRNDGQQYWNGIPMGAAASGSASIDDVQNNIYTAWKILHPTRSKSVSAGVQYRTGFTDPSNANAVATTWQQIDKETGIPNTAVSSNTFFDINLMIWPEKIEDNIVYFNRIATGSYNSLQVEDARRAGTVFGLPNANIPSVNTIEIPKSAAMLAAITDTVNTMASITWQNYYGNATSIPRSDDDWLDPYLVDIAEPTVNHKIAIKNFLTQDAKTIQGISTVQGSFGGRTTNALLGISFPNYVQAQLPRPYFEGEELHFAITIKIAGVEYLVDNTKLILDSQFGVEFNLPHRTSLNSMGSSDPSGANHFTVTVNNDDNGPFDDPHVGNYVYGLSGNNAGGDAGNYGRRTQSAGYASIGANNPSDINAIIGEPIEMLNGKPRTKIVPPTTNNNDIFGGQSMLLKSWNTIAFSLMITKKAMQTLMEQNASEMNVYLLSADQEADFFVNVGLWSPQEPPATLYKPSLKADKDNIDYSKFGLVKKFLIEGKGSRLTYDPTNEKPYEKLHYRATNAWYTPTDGKYIWAIPQQFDSSDTINTVMQSTVRNAMNLLSLLGTDRDWSTLNYYAKKILTSNNTSSTVLTAVGAGNNAKHNYWTPDFYIWDYPSDTSFLALGGSGKYWEGTGAELLCTVQGITFISGCRNETFELEQAKVRWGVIQNGVASYDAFYKENEIKFGSLPHTALVNYRDTLWVFNREEFYRLALPNPYDTSTWQILDKQEGQGAFCTKQTIVTPYGVAYANENGIWMSDGGKPTCLTNNPNQGVGINGIYQRLALPESSIISGIEQNPLTDKIPALPSGYTFNPKNELIYDMENDELVYIASGNINYAQYTTNANGILAENATIDSNPSEEIRLVFNFAKQNWRVETYILGQLTNTKIDESSDLHWLKSTNAAGGSNTTGFYSGVSTSLNSVLNGRMHVANPSIWSLRTSLVNVDSDILKLGSAVYESLFIPQIMKPNKNTITDIQIGTRLVSTTPIAGSVLSTGVALRFPGLDLTIADTYIIPIVGRFITHMIGDGNNDYILKRVYATLGLREDSLTAAIQGFGYLYAMPANIQPGAFKALNIANGLIIDASQDPCIAYEVRPDHDSANRTSNIGSRTKYTDLVGMNFATKNNAARNPFRSTLQTPGGTNQANANDKYTATESLVLNAPLNAQYRFTRFVFQSEVVQKVMGFVFEAVQFGRRSQ